MKQREKSFSFRTRKKNSSVRTSQKWWAEKEKKKEEEEAGEERDKEGERMKIKEHVCKLTLTAQQGARVDRGER